MRASLRCASADLMGLAALPLRIIILSDNMLLVQRLRDAYLFVP